VGFVSRAVVEPLTALARDLLPFVQTGVKGIDELCSRAAVRVRPRLRWGRPPRVAQPTGSSLRWIRGSSASWAGVIERAASRTFAWDSCIRPSTRPDRA